MPFVFNRFPVWSEQRQCSNNVPHLRQEPVTPADFPIAPRVTGVLHHTKKQRNTTFPETELPNGSGDYGPPDVPRGPPGARSPRWAPQLEATLAFPPF